MTTIKGPITIKKPGNVAEAVRRLYGNQTGSVKLPFEATGWKSTKMPEVQVIGIDTASASTDVAAAPVPEPKKKRRE
jgi:hypothetical protein